MLINEYPEKTIRSDADKLLIHDISTNAYHNISIANLITGLSDSSGGSDWLLIGANTNVSGSAKLLCNPSTSGLTVTLPSAVTGNPEVEILSVASQVNLNFNGLKFKGITPQNPYINGDYQYTKLVYVNSSIGWIETNKAIKYTVPYSSGMSLWLEDGSLSDKSGNSNNTTAVNTSTPPNVAIGIDSKNVLRWNGSQTQELQISPFLSSATEATLYIVFSLNNSSQYNLIRTANLDDYWRFSGDGNGYFGTFSSSRRGGFPSSMPTTGNHLISIHSDSSNYEVLLNNVSKGSQSTGFSAGDRFRIGTNDKPFNGDIALILVYPSLLSPSSNQHLANVAAIKSNYPSLSI